MATPPFLAGPSGAQAPAPVSSPLGGGAAGQPTDQMQQLLKMILSGAQQRPQVAQPTPAPIPPGAPNQPTLVGKHTGPANLGAAIGSTIQNAVHQEKQKKLAAATSDWTDLLTSTQKYMTPDGKVDPKAYQDPAVMQVLGDPKKLKRMAKALNQDWLNPKPDEYADALKVAMKQHTDKQGAIQGLKQTMQQMVQHIRGQGQQGQVSPQGAESIMSRAPIAAPAQDPAQAAKTLQATAEMQKAQADLTRAQTEAKDKYQIQPTGTGTVVAIDKQDPTKVIQVTDEKGNPITAAPKGVQSGSKPAMVNGVPIGVTKSINGKNTTVLPGDPNWTGADDKIFHAATAATASSNATKDHRIAVASETRAKSYAQTREYAVIDSSTGQEQMVSADQINQAPKGTYAPASGGAKIMNAQAIFGEIDYTSGQLKQSIEEMGDSGFDPKARAQIAAVLRDTDPRTAWNQFLTSEVAGTLTDPQIRYVTSLVSMDESAMSLRSVAGQGQSSDSMRSRISAMLPSAGTPSAKYARQQMKLFDGELSALRKGIPGLGSSSGNKTSQGGPKPGKVEGGYRFKGGDPGDKSNWVKVQ